MNDTVNKAAASAAISLGALIVVMLSGCASCRIPAAYLRATTDAERAAAWPAFHRPPTPGCPNYFQSD